MTAAMRLAVAGANGRMGRALVEAIQGDASLILAAALEMPGSAALGRDAGEPGGVSTGVPVSSDVAAALARADAIIDFTRPEGTLAHLAACVSAGRAMVIGTTGFSPAQKDQIAAAAARIPVAMAANFAIGVNVFYQLAESAARILGEDFDVEIIEAHHRHKVDAPSGTALRLGERIAAARGQDLARHAVFGRHGDTGERPAGAIGFHALRGGDIVGEHTVLFAGNGERLEVSVRSASRTTYAHGALRAAKFLRDRAPGLYGMEQVLGLN